MIRAGLILAVLASVVASGPRTVVTFADGSSIEATADPAGPDLVLLTAQDAEFLVPRRVLADPPPPAAAAPAAPDPGPDRLRLRDGSLVIGEIVAETPETLEVLRLGRRRGIPRARIDSVERAGAPPLTPAMAALARSALPRLGDGDGSVRESARRTLEALGPSVRPILWEEVGKPDLPAEVLAALRALLAEPLRETPPSRLPPRLFQLLRDPAAGEGPLTERLGLTAEQRKRVREILADSAAGMASATALPRGEAAERMRSIAEDFRRRLSEMLTDVQRRLFEEMIVSGR